MCAYADHDLSKFKDVSAPLISSDQRRTYVGNTFVGYRRGSHPVLGRHFLRPQKENTASSSPWAKRLSCHRKCTGHAEKSRVDRVRGMGERTWLVFSHTTRRLDPHTFIAMS